MKIEYQISISSHAFSTVKPVLGDHWHERLAELTEHAFLGGGPTVQLNINKAVCETAKRPHFHAQMKFRPTARFCMWYIHDVTNIAGTKIVRLDTGVHTKMGSDHT